MQVKTKQKADFKTPLVSRVSQNKIGTFIRKLLAEEWSSNSLQWQAVSKLITYTLLPTHPEGWCMPEMVFSDTYLQKLTCYNSNNWLYSVVTKHLSVSMRKMNELTLVLYTGFKLNFIKLSLKIAKAVGKHLQWFDASSCNFEIFTPLNSLKLYFQLSFPLNEQSNWSKYQLNDIAWSCVKILLHSIFSKSTRLQQLYV